jgi:hypothetical protein
MVKLILSFFELSIIVLYCINAFKTVQSKNINTWASLSERNGESSLLKLNKSSFDKNRFLSKLSKIGRERSFKFDALNNNESRSRVMQRESNLKNNKVDVVLDEIRQVEGKSVNMKEKFDLINANEKKNTILKKSVKNRLFHENWKKNSEYTTPKGVSQMLSLYNGLKFGNSLIDINQVNTIRYVPSTKGKKNLTNY